MTCLLLGSTLSEDSGALGDLDSDVPSSPAVGVLCSLAPLELPFSGSSHRVRCSHSRLQFSFSRAQLCSPIASKFPWPYAPPVAVWI
jgi:hypothetical protein